MARQRRPPEGQRPPEQEGFPPEVAAALATAAAGGAGAAPAAGGLAGLALTAEQIRQAAAAIIKALVSFGLTRSGDDHEFILIVLQQRFPDRPRSELERIAAEELKREREFLRKQRERVERDIPEALADADPTRRQERVNRILEREKRYLVMRREAMTERAIVAAEMEYVREASPEGAYWKLSPYVREHTLDCLAMGEKFWPWNVLALIHPQLHPGCRCQLLTKAEAVARDLMDPDQVPTPKDAARMAKKLMTDAQRLMEEGVTPAEIDEVIDYRQAELEEATATRGAKAVASGARFYGAKAFERFGSGLEKGGEFKPRRGGFSRPTGSRFKALRGLIDLKTPKAKRQDKDGRWTNLDGRMVKVPEARAFDRTIGDRRFTSPSGSTNVYRDGRPYDAPRFSGRKSPGTAPEGPHLDRNGQTVRPGATVVWGGDPRYGAPDNKKGWAVGFSTGLFEDENNVDLLFKSEDGRWRSTVAAPDDLRVVGDEKAAQNLPKLLAAQAKLKEDSAERERQRLEDDPTLTFEEPDSTLKQEWADTFHLPKDEGMAARLEMLGLTKGQALKQLQAPDSNVSWLWTTGRRQLPDDARQKAIDRLTEMVRARHEEGPSQRILRAVGELDIATPPVKAGEPGEGAHRALLKGGFHETEVLDRPDTTTVNYIHAESGSTLGMEVDKATGQVVDHEWEPRATELPAARKLEGEAPGTWQDFAADISATVNELGSKHGAETLLTSVEYRPDKHADHGGEHTWAGAVELGADTAPALDALRVARRQNRPLEPSEAKSVYGSYKTAYHEALHGVNPIPIEQYHNPVLGGLEEALTEETATITTHEALSRHDAGDVVQWAAKNPHDYVVQGTYSHDRVRLDVILDRAGVSAERRPAVIEELKFRTLPKDRARRLGEMVAEAERARGGRLTDDEEAWNWVADQMTAYPDHADFTPMVVPQGARGSAALLAPAVTHLGADITPGTRVTVRKGTELREGEVVTVTDATNRGYAFVAGVRYEDGSGAGAVLPHEIVDVGGPPSGAPQRLRVLRKEKGEEGREYDVEVGPGDRVRYDGRGDGGTSEARVERVLRTDNPASPLGRRGWAIQAVTTEDSEAPGTRIILTHDRAGWLERADGAEVQLPTRPGEGGAANFEREEPPVTVGTGRPQPPLGEPVGPHSLHPGERFLDTVGQVWEVRSVAPKRRGRTQLELAHADGPFAGMSAGRVTYGPDEAPFWYRYDEKVAAAHALAQERAWRALGGGRANPPAAPDPGHAPRPNLWHGTTKGAIPGGGFSGSEVYLAHDRELADAYGDTPGSQVLEVQDLSERPLILDTPEKFRAAWEESGAGEVGGNFHPNQTSAFAAWARGKGYDAVDIPSSAFEQDTGDAEADYQAYRRGPAGYFGDPQTIILDPAKARIVSGRGPAAPVDTLEGLDAVRAAHPGVQLDAYESDEGIRLSLIRTVGDNRGKGLASDAMRDLIRYADSRGKPIALTPDPLGAGGMSKTALTAWYKQMGFRPNRGGKKDFRFRETMLREPRVTSGRRNPAFSDANPRGSVSQSMEPSSVLARRFGKTTGKANPDAEIEALITDARSEFPGLKLELTDAGDYLELGYIEVPDEARGAGVGSTVVGRVRDLADRRGKAVLLLASSPEGEDDRLQEFYEALGFEEVPSVDFGIEAEPGFHWFAYLPEAPTGKANPAAGEPDWVAIDKARREFAPAFEKMAADAAKEGVHMDAAHMGDYVFLFDLRVDEAPRGEGRGGRTLDRIAQWAADHDVPLVLSPEPDTDELKDALDRFYKRHGFVQLEPGRITGFNDALDSPEDMPAPGFKYLVRWPDAKPTGKANPAPEPKGQLAGGKPPSAFANLDFTVHPGPATPAIERAEDELNAYAARADANPAAWGEPEERRLEALGRRLSALYDAAGVPEDDRVSGLPPARTGKANPPSGATPTTIPGLKKRTVLELRQMERDAEESWDRAIDIDSYTDENGEFDPELEDEAVAAERRWQGRLEAIRAELASRGLKPEGFSAVTVTGKAQPSFFQGGGTGIGGGKLKGLFGWAGSKGDPLLFDEPYDKEKDPGAEPKRPVPKPPKHDDSGKLTHVKPAGGSNGAQWFEDDAGDRWLVKTYRGDIDRVATELTANAVYRELGAVAPEAGAIGVGGKPAIGYKALEGEVREHVFSKEGPNADFSKHFMTDALLANWDFVGLDDDNVLWDAEGKPIRVDQGGTFAFRAMGGEKPYGPVPTEVWTMLSPKGQGFRSVSLSEGEKKEQAAEIGERLPDGKIDALVDAAPWQDADMRENVRAALKARVGWMRRYADGLEEIPKPSEGEEARSALSTRQDGLDLYPEQDLAVKAFGAGWSDAVNDHLREGRKKGESPGEVDFVISELDSLLRFAKTDEDVTVYAAVDADLEPGSNFADKGFMGMSLDRAEADAAGGTLLRILLPAGASAFYTGDLEDRPEGTPDVIVRRGQKYRVVGSTTVDGRTVLDVVAV